MRVVVEPYNPQWPRQFADIKAELAAALEGLDVIGIEHVGSTSVPGLSAKPTIDIDIIVAPEALPFIFAALTEKAGYVYVGEMGIVDRHAFRSHQSDPPRNVYVCVDGCLAVRNHLSVRDLLRADSGLREEYAKVKMELACHDWIDVDEYCEAKNDILQHILEKAGLGDEERGEIRKANTVEGGREERCCSAR